MGVCTYTARLLVENKAVAHCVRVRQLPGVCRMCNMQQVTLYTHATTLTCDWHTPTADQCIHAVAHPSVWHLSTGVLVPTLRRPTRRPPLLQVPTLFANTQRSDWRPARPTLGGHLHTLNPRRLGFHRSRFHRLFHRYQLILNDEGCFGVASNAFCAIATSFATASPDTLRAAWAFLSSRRARASHATLATCAAAALDAIPKEDMAVAQKKKGRNDAGTSGRKTLNIDKWQR